MKLVFDNSIHLGQFCITDERLRIAAKNSQVMISTKPGDQIIGIESFNENSFSDHTIWALERGVQDTFYRFMDVYHSVKNVVRVPLAPQDAEKALALQRQLNVDLSNALTCALALRFAANEIHSFYGELRRDDVMRYVRLELGVRVTQPDAAAEHSFPGELEQYYQDALAAFRNAKVNLPDEFHA
jgi:hypothetical protein